MSRRVTSLSSLHRQRGTTMIGLIIGIVIGLAVAAGVALFVTKATIPFVSKAPRAPVTSEPAGAKLPDPNRGLYAKDPMSGATTSSAAPAPESTVIVPPPPNVAPGADGRAPVVDPSKLPTNITTLQAGAFSNADDAESMRGRLALLGFDSKVVQGEREGGKIFRVRLGPYGRIEELNRARQRLIENGVEATLVAPGK